MVQWEWWDGRKLKNKNPVEARPKCSVDEHEDLDDGRVVIRKSSQRKLTRAIDRLPALTGLATPLQPRKKDMYMAGLWQNDLTSHLLWRR